MQTEQDFAGRSSTRRRPTSRRSVRLRSAPASAPRDDAGTAGRALAACREALATGGSPSSLLADVRRALGAGEIVVLAEDRPHGERLTMTASPAAPLPSHPAQLGQMQSVLRERAGGEPASRLGPLLATLGIADPASAAAFTLDEGDGRRSTTVACWHEQEPLSPVWMGVVAAGLASSLAALRERDAAAEAAARRHRAALAERLHEGPLQILAGSVLELEATATGLAPGSAEASALGACARRLRQASTEFRAAIGGLLSARAGGGDLRRQIEEAAARSSLPVRLSIEGTLAEVSRTTASLGAAVVREALANAGKHAGAEAVAVHVSAGPELLVVAVRDQGRGFTPADRERALAGNHLGLALLERRVRDAGGSLRILSTPDTGTRVVARIPIDEVTS